MDRKSRHIIFKLPPSVWAAETPPGCLEELQYNFTHIWFSLGGESQTHCLVLTVWAARKERKGWTSRLGQDVLQEGVQEVPLSFPRETTTDEWLNVWDIATNEVRSGQSSRTSWAWRRWPMCHHLRPTAVQLWPQTTWTLAGWCRRTPQTEFF